VDEKDRKVEKNLKEGHSSERASRGGGGGGELKRRTLKNNCVGKNQSGHGQTRIKEIGLGERGGRSSSDRGYSRDNEEKGLYNKRSDPTSLGLVKKKERERIHTTKTLSWENR